MAIGAISDQKLHGFLQRLRGGFEIAELKKLQSLKAF